MLCLNYLQPEFSFVNSCPWKSQPFFNRTPFLYMLSRYMSKGLANLSVLPLHNKVAPYWLDVIVNRRICFFLSQEYMMELLSMASLLFLIFLVLSKCLIANKVHSRAMKTDGRITHLFTIKDSNLWSGPIIRSNSLRSNERKYFTNC